MASAASTPFASTKETTNFARLSRLLVDVGTQVLRKRFDKIHPPATLRAVLNRHERKLQDLHTKKKVLNVSQMEELYPEKDVHGKAHVPVSSANFDITLLTVLLRNICGLANPVRGWDELPAAANKNMEDDIARIKYYRNTLYGHASRASIDDASFNRYWQEIREALVRLGGTDYAVTIDNMKIDIMDHECEERYRKLLREMKKEDESVKDKLEEIKDTIRDDQQEMKGEIIESISKKLKLDTDNIGVKLEQMKSGQEHNKRITLEQMKEIKDFLAASAVESINKDKLEQMKSALENNIRGMFELQMKEIRDNLATSAEENIDEGELEQMKSGLEDIRGTMEQMKSGLELQMKEMKDILAASAEENIDEVKGRDDLGQMKSEILGNISERLDTLTAGVLDNITDTFAQMRTEMENSRATVDKLITVAEEKKKEGPEQEGVSGTSGTVAADVAGCSGTSQQAHHDQDFTSRRSNEKKLHTASENGDIGVIKSLLASGVNVNSKDVLGNTPLMKAAHHGKIGAFQVLRDHGADPLLRNKYEYSLLHWAAKGGSTNIINELLPFFPDVDVKSEKGSTPLMIAADYNKPNAFELLIKEGADQFLKNDDGSSLLHFAVRSRNISIIKKLLSDGHDVNSVEKGGFTPLMLAASENNPIAFQLLIDEGADANAKDYKGQSLMHYAVDGNSISIIDKLISLNVDIYSKDEKGENALRASEVIDNSEAVNYLWSKGKFDQ